MIPNKIQQTLPFRWADIDEVPEDEVFLEPGNCECNEGIFESGDCECNEGIVESRDCECNEGILKAGDCEYRRCRLAA